MAELKISKMIEGVVLHDNGRRFRQRGTSGHDTDFPRCFVAAGMPRQHHVVGMHVADGEVGRIIAQRGIIHSDIIYIYAITTTFEGDILPVASVRGQINGFVLKGIGGGTID